MDMVFQNVYNECLRYFNGDELAVNTWINKYAVKDKEGNLKETSPDDMHRRMAREFIRIENSYAIKDKSNHSKYGKIRQLLTEEKIYSYFKNFKYIIPQGSVMLSLGNPYVIASLSNCVVLPEIYDSYGGIFNTDQQLAQLFKRRCGVGIDISSLRPAKSPVSNAAGTTTGAVSFMERFSNTTREVSQNGRRGALMITMDISHPDIEAFITSKQDLKKITGANISVRLSDAFMNAVVNNDDFTLKWPVNSASPTILRKVKAQNLWNLIITCAHQTAEPGLIFWDRQHFYSTSSVYPEFKNISTNPCSEIAMQGGDSCRLMAINLYSFVNSPFTNDANFDFEKFYEVTYESLRLMDDLVDLELEAIQRILKKIDADPEPEKIKSVEKEIWQLLADNGRKGRRTGLGFTALADTLAAMNLKFDSDEALSLSEKILKTKCEAEFESSIDLAIERGRFSNFDPAIENTSDFMLMLKDEFPEVYNRMMQYGRRNISLSTVAPTGTLSLLAQTSSGIEPVFMLSYKRRTKVNAKESAFDFLDESGDAWKEYSVYHPKLSEWMKVTGNSDQNKSPYTGSTANEIDWKRRVELQGVIQKYVTHSISSTINLPAEISPETVGSIYLHAWKSGLKGITVYREGSRSGVLIPDKSNFENTTQEIVARPKELLADVLRFKNGQENWVAVVGLLHEKPYEIFTGRVDEDFNLPENVSKGRIVKDVNESGLTRYDFIYNQNGKEILLKGLSQTFNKEYWNYAKLISGVLRQKMPIKSVVDLIHNLKMYDESINTWKNGVERVLRRYIALGEIAEDRLCYECGDTSGLIYEEGCLKCKSCGATYCQ